MYHFYKINRIPANLPDYAIRNHSNGVTGYQSKIDENLTSELNLVYLGYGSEKQVEEFLANQFHGTVASKYNRGGMA